MTKSQSSGGSAALQYEPQQRRTRELQVLALGLPRTGTASMRLALERLGYLHCAHGFDLVDSQAYARRWEEVIDIKMGTSRHERPLDRAVWDELLGHCAAVTDMPCAIFWQELVASYPEAKVVLVQRDEDSWFRSMSTSVIEPMFSTSGKISRCVVEPLLGSRVGPMCVKALQCFFEADDEHGMKSLARPAYRKHYEQVRAAVPPERLLEFRLGSGWLPLCTFLGKPIPNSDFPWVNESDALREKIKQVQEEMRQQLKGTAIKLLLWTTPLAVAAGLLFYLN